MTTVYAYRNFKGVRKDGTTVYGIIPQFDGSTYAGFNCGACSEAMRDVSQQKGVRPSRGTPWQPTGKRIRTATGDTNGGLNPTQTTAATRSVYGIPTATPRIASKDAAMDLLEKGYAVDLLVSYGPINDYLSGSPGFTGNHRGVMVGRSVTSDGKRELWADPLYDGRRSGIPLGQKWIPQSVLMEAASELDLGGGVRLYKKYGYDDAYYIPSLTHLTVKKYKVVVPATKLLGRYRLNNGVIVSREITKTGGFEASCTAPTAYAWPGHGTYKLVRIISGGDHNGWYINAKYAREV